MWSRGRFFFCVLAQPSVPQDLHLKREAWRSESCSKHRFLPASRQDYVASVTKEEHALAEELLTHLRRSKKRESPLWSDLRPRDLSSGFEKGPGSTLRREILQRKCRSWVIDASESERLLTKLSLICTALHSDSAICWRCVWALHEAVRCPVRVDIGLPKPSHRQTCIRSLG